MCASIRGRPLELCRSGITIESGNNPANLWLCETVFDLVDFFEIVPEISQLRLAVDETPY